MRIFALELNNEIKGIKARKKYIESLIVNLPSPELVVLPELSICSYMASQEIWQYADDFGRDTATWAVEMAQKYNTYIGVGYLDKEKDDYFNRYMIAGKGGVCGIVTKSEGESAVFKRGRFGSLIETPFGTVAVAICYDSRRKHFYDNIKDRQISLILFPHGAPADPVKSDDEKKTNDYFCGCYVKAFDVPVVYVNSVGALEYMPGKMGRMMEKAGFRMNGRTKIYGAKGACIDSDIAEAAGVDAVLVNKSRQSDIRFYGEDINKGNRLFRKFILEPDVKMGIRMYEKGKQIEKAKALS